MARGGENDGRGAVRVGDMNDKEKRLRNAYRQVLVDAKAERASGTRDFFVHIFLPWFIGYCEDRITELSLAVEDD